MAVTITQVDEAFSDWQTLLSLLHQAFEYQNGRINPPSSLHRLDVKSIAQKAQQERLFLAWAGSQIIGCLFAKPCQDCVYVGKLAILKKWQGQGIGKRLMGQAISFAKREGYSELELQVRIELVENQAVFAAMGFIESNRTAHLGFDKPTSITMRKPI